jgi:hypothetical protein
MATKTYDIPISFTDPAINGGAPTPGELEVTGFASSGPNGLVASMTLDSFTYQPLGSAAADSGSTLALLALGAGGVIALRQRRKADAAQG